MNVDKHKVGRDDVSHGQCTRGTATVNAFLVQAETPWLKGVVNQRDTVPAHMQDDLLLDQKTSANIEMGCAGRAKDVWR